MTAAVPVQRVISAASFVTSLGGGALPEAVRAAVTEATASTWRPDDLQEWAGAVIAEATAELPPSSNLRRFVDEGAALVAFSGGKAIRGPQGSGILAGRRDLIASVRLQTLDMDVDVAA